MSPRRGRRGRGGQDTAPQRQVNYTNLTSPFPVMKVFTDDRIEAMHEAALSILEDQGIKVILPEARQLFKAAGATVDEASEMVWIGREIVEAALASAPRKVDIKAATPERDISLELGRFVFQPGAGCPHATDRIRGRRPGTARDYQELVQLSQHFDVIHMIPPLVEPQNVPMHLRHYELMKTQLIHSDKVPFIFSRGTPQVEDSIQMLKEFRGLSDEEFQSQSHCYTIINTNSPRIIDIPMAQGLIDFAKAGQPSIVTPFTLMGAMAPITVAGAITLSHAEAMAGITLTQLAKEGAPVLYGTFTSNVDMKSGAPAFGTPEHFKASLAAGQLARKIGLPWRCATGSAANTNDAQASNETQFALWGCLLAGASVIIHSAGWLEGGLTNSYEKFITDVEVLQMVAELCRETMAGDAEIGLDALLEVGPGGHFFGAAHTMERYQTEFYQPFSSDWSNFGAWTEKGSLTADERATGIWQNILQSATPPISSNPDRIADLDRFIARRTSEGGAAPES